jgi:hypothetical protein
MDGDGTMVVDAGSEQDVSLLGDLGGGDQGDQGDQGDAGDQGDQGDQQGDAGDQGDQGDQGDAGAGGDAAAQAAQRADKTRAEVVKFLREGRNDPERKPLIDALSKAWYRDQEYAALGDIKDLRSLKEQIDILGGPEAIGRLRDLETSVELIDKMVDTGDPQVVRDLFDESPDGMKKLVPVVLDNLRTLDVNAYAETLIPHLAQALDSSPMPEWIRNADGLLKKAYQATDAEHVKFYIEQAFAEIKGASNWLGAVKSQAAERQGAGAGSDGAAGTGRVAAGSGVGAGGGAGAGAGGDAGVVAQVQSQLVPWAKTEIEKALKPLLGATKLDAAKQADMVSLIAAEVDRRLAADQSFQTNLKAWQKTGKADRILKQSQSGISSVLAASARAVWERHGTKGSRDQGTRTTQRQGTGNREQGTGNRTQTVNKTAVLVSRKPADGDFAPGQDMIDAMIKQQGYIKDGNGRKLVRWK